MFPDGGELAYWRRYRGELMCSPELGPGLRPHAYWTHDLGLRPAPTWPFDQIQALLDRGLLISEEALRIERTWPMLNPDQSLTFCSNFESLETIRWQQLDPRTLLGIAHEFDIASTFHARYGRPELSQKYAQRARVCRNAALSE